MSFSFANLAASYDRGDLVPFIGSGMSVPACATWKEMVFALEKSAGLPHLPSEDLIWRSQRALEGLRASRANVAKLVYDSISLGVDCPPPPQTQLLASINWPLVCTTNYDDVYLRAVLTHPGREIPQVFGRTETDCRRVLQHLGMPVHEAIWALQGFLGGRNDVVRKMMPQSFDHIQAENEIVVGHAEYRKAANRAPHFRRCFAEVFRTKSFLFLGTGLTEPYFLSLFDEVIELAGPPKQPHFALMPEGRVDVDFMLRHYHIVCRTYPVNESAPADQRHSAMRNFLGEFCNFMKGERTRASTWGYQLQTSAPAKSSSPSALFRVQRGSLPQSMGMNEVAAISCGRARDQNAPNLARGVPLVGRTARSALCLPEEVEYEWLEKSDWVVKLDGRGLFGIVARELVGPKISGDGSRNRRSPDAIRHAFYDFLDEMVHLGVRTVHVQLLAAGKYRAFHAWVSLVQMARAFGEWHRAQLHAASGGAPLFDATVWVVDASVIAMLQGNFIDLAEQLEDTSLRVTVEIIHENQEVVRYHRFVDGATNVGMLIPYVERIVEPYPSLILLPAIHKKGGQVDFASAIKKSIRDFGLVSGSTLVIDFSRQDAQNS